MFGHDMVTTGAQSDIEQATRMARAMVTRFGMSDSLGPIAYAENQEEVFLGHCVSRTQNISEATAQKIDSEIHRIIDECYERATGHPHRPRCRPATCWRAACWNTRP